MKGDGLGELPKRALERLLGSAAEIKKTAPVTNEPAQFFVGYLLAERLERIYSVKKVTAEAGRFAGEMSFAA